MGIGKGSLSPHYSLIHMWHTGHCVCSYRLARHKYGEYKRFICHKDWIFYLFLENFGFVTAFSVHTLWSCYLLKLRCPFWLAVLYGGGQGIKCPAHHQGEVSGPRLTTLLYFMLIINMSSQDYIDVSYITFFLSFSLYSSFFLNLQLISYP